MRPGWIPWVARGYLVHDQRPRLEHVECARCVQGPLDVLRAPEVLLEHPSDPGELAELR